MIINFLQTRNPPILPSLHQRPHNKLTTKDGFQSSFADDLSVLAGFGSKNEETLGQLLFSFFRFYGHEFDYEKLVVSVRSGKHISKVDKKWDTAFNNRLCVEEPFNVSRNLGNTLDEMSFRGLHMELRKAFDLVADGKLEECCEQYEFPVAERRQMDRKPTAKPSIIRITPHNQPHKGGRGGARGNRQNNHHRNGNNNRRASSSGAYEISNGYPPMSAQETWLQQQAQAQLHNDLYTTYAALQLQENNLRTHLYIQSQQYLMAQAAQGQSQSSTYSQSQTRSTAGSSALQPSDNRMRTNSFNQVAPHTAPLQSDRSHYYFPLYNQAVYSGYPNPSTNPSSPLLSSAVPDMRRSIHRSSVTNGSVGPPNSALRSHSQPAARSVPSPLLLQGMGAGNHGLGIYPSPRQVNGIPIPNFMHDENSDFGTETPTDSLANTPPTESAEATTPKELPREYVGWYVQPGPVPNTIRRETAPISSIPTFGEFPRDPSRRRMSTDHLPQAVLNHMKHPPRKSRSPSPLGYDRTYSSGTHSAPLTAVPSQQGASSNNLRVLGNTIPPIVDGSNITAPISIPQWQAAVSEETEAQNVETNTCQSFSTSSGLSLDKEFTDRPTWKETRAEKNLRMPMVVNGSTLGDTEAFPSFSSPPVVNGATNHVLSTANGAPIEQTNGTIGISPGSRIRLTRQIQNGGMSPLDIGVGQDDGLREELPHLSPVYETRTPSPTTNRKFEPSLERKLSAATVKAKESKSEDSRPGSKLGPANGNQMKHSSLDLKPNSHTRNAKSEGNIPGGWQKIPKNKKKGSVPDNKSNGHGQAHGEKVPYNDSERKGG